jgi:prepilin-type processing-associated H-X9-DG protein
MSCDLLFRPEWIAHKKGGGKYPAGVNALFADGSVSFSNNPDAFKPELWKKPVTDAYVFRTILKELEH